MSDVSFEQVKHMVEQLPPDEVERLRVWLNVPPISAQEANTPSWGETLADLIENFPLGDDDQMAIDDPEAWVRERRRTKTGRRNPGWG